MSSNLRPFIKEHCPCWAGLDIDAQCAGTPNWTRYPKTKKGKPISASRSRLLSRTETISGVSHEAVRWLSNLHKGVVGNARPDLKSQLKHKVEPQRNEGRYEPVKRHNETGKCFILEGNPCSFFERHVLPVAKKYGTEKQIAKLCREPKPPPEKAEAKGSSLGGLVKHCERCNKFEVYGRTRFCRKCAKIQKRESNRDWARKIRKNKKYRIL